MVQQTAKVPESAYATNGKIPGVNLHHNHLVDLRASGLSNETIKSSGCYSESNFSELKVLMNYGGAKKWPPKNGAALVFPYLDHDGKTMFYRVKPDNPPLRDGKRAKYLQPSGTAVRIYIPPQARKKLKDKSNRLIITEGEKKALAGTQAGVTTIGLPGVTTWHKKNSQTLLPELAALDLEGREIFIAFDSDIVEKPQVALEERKLAAALASHGAKVKVVRIPAKGEKRGLDDYLVAEGGDAVYMLLMEAHEPEPLEPDESEKPKAQLIDPYPTAKDILDCDAVDGDYRLRHYHGSFWLWSGGRYRELDDQDVRNGVIEYLDRHYSFVKRDHTNNVVDAIKAACAIRSTVAWPTWLSGASSGWEPRDILATRNELIHLPSLVEGADAHIPATPKFFTPSAVDFVFDRDAPEPTSWLKFLDDLWSGDAGSIRLLQQWFGYCLTPDTRQQKILLLIGPKRAGKGTIVKILERLVGQYNVVGPTLASFSGEFGLEPLIGKTLACISDARLSRRSGQSAVVERLLSVSGEDRLTINRKHKTMVTERRIMIVSNEIPRFTDASTAIVSRMVALQCNKSFLGREDLGLFDRLAPELPGILLWAIEGWRNLRDCGYLQPPSSSEGLIDEMETLSSPVAAFVRDECEANPEETIETGELYSRYQKWCEAHGYRAGSSETFGRDLRAATNNQVKKCRIRVGGSRPYVYRGVKWTG